MNRSLGKILTICLCSTILSCDPMYTEKDLLGIWQGVHDGNELIFEFKRDRTCQFSFRNINSGTVERINGNFETDFSKIPVPLTIRNIPQLSHPLHTILFFIEDDSLRIAKFAPRWRLRPVAFDNHTSMNFKRLEESGSPF